MAVSTEILKAYAAPRATLRRQLSSGQNEGRALGYLIVACLLFFVAQWPRISREAFLNAEVSREQLLAGALIGWLFFAPLFFYLLAAVTHIFARIVGGKGTWFSARLALFWSLLAITPLFLFQGLVAGFIGQGPALTLTSILLLAIFVYIWACSLVEAERKAP